LPHLPASRPSSRSVAAAPRQAWPNWINSPVAPQRPDWQLRTGTGRPAGIRIKLQISSASCRHCDWPL